MGFAAAAGRLLLGWVIIGAIFLGLGYVRFLLRDVSTQNKRWVGTLGNVTRCETITASDGRRVGYRHTFSYKVARGDRLQQKVVLDQPHDLGETLPIEYFEREPALFRELGRPANWIEVMGRGWMITLAVGCALTMMGYFFWMMKRVR